MGKRTWFNVTGNAGTQRGFPSPEGNAQRRDPAFGDVAPFGGVIQVQTRPYSRGAAAFVPNFGTVFSNPIGGGVVCKYPPQASYGMPAQYAAEQLFWTPQAIPTNIPMQGLTDPAELQALLSTVDVTAMMNY